LTRNSSQRKVDEVAQGGSPKLELAERELTRELARKASLEQRGITVITASGTFVTLVFAFVTVVQKGHRFNNFTHAEKALLFTALTLFSLAALFGLLTNIPARYGAIPLDLLNPHESAQDPIDRGTVEAIIEAAKSIRKVNRDKANWLVWAFLFQLLGIGTLSASVLTLIHL
jgi:hypothetical protein